MSTKAPLESRRQLEAAATTRPAVGSQPSGRRTRTHTPAVAGAQTARFHRILPATLWTREWLLTLGRPRSAAIKVAMPLVLSVPLVSGGAPTFWAGMLLTVLVAMVGAVGSGVALARARSGGLLARLAVVPRAPSRLAGEWVLAATAVDTVQMLPVAAVVVASHPSASAALALLACIPAVLLFTNALGCALSLLADGPGEVLLDVMVVLAPLLFLGGLFTGVPREGWRWVAARLDPFAYLHAAFTGALGGVASFSAAEVLVAAAVTASISLAALAAVGRALLARA
ncbi:MAG TPA: ABC transporter permease [Candidatus Dormibacteraeota bacterium]|nr:ABC transporter permease [Candidatus Dormibacteraeota bacterium]